MWKTTPILASNSNFFGKTTQKRNNSQWLAPNFECKSTEAILYLYDFLNKFRVVINRSMELSLNSVSLLITTRDSVGKSQKYKTGLGSKSAGEVQRSCRYNRRRVLPLRPPPNPCQRSGVTLLHTFKTMKQYRRYYLSDIV